MMMKAFAPEIRLVVYVVGIYSVFIYWGYLQEKIVSTQYVVESGRPNITDSPIQTLPWSFPFFLNFCMAAMCVITANIVELVYPTPPSNVPALAFWKAAISSAIASPIGYEALKYISYPMMILTKSSKPVPVMLAGFFYFNRKYTWYKCTGVAFVCIGITMFTLYKSSSKSSKQTADSSSQSLSSTIFGIFLVLVNLGLDGYTNNEQDEIFLRYRIKSLDMMKYVNMWQSLYIFAYLGLGYLIYGNGSEIYGSVVVISSCPTIRYDLFMFCMCASLGQVLLFTLIKEFGSLLWVTVSVTRKLFTVLASVVIFKHAVNLPQWMGIAFVFSGLMLEIIMSHRNKEKVDAKETGGDKED
jgi:UDP-galactose transporter B1